MAGAAKPKVGMSVHFVPGYGKGDKCQAATITAVSESPRPLVQLAEGVMIEVPRDPNVRDEAEYGEVTLQVLPAGAAATTGYAERSEDVHLRYTWHDAAKCDN